MELHFKFNDNDTEDFHIITNAKNYFGIVKDVNKWLESELRSDLQYYDKETIEYIQTKLYAIALSHGITL